MIVLVAAEGISLLGTRISFIALPWLVLITTHNPIRMGVVTGAASVPYVLNGFIAAPLVDRIGARRMSILTDVFSAITMAAVTVAFHSGIVVLSILVAIGGSLRGVGDRAKNVMLKPILDAAGTNVLRLTSLYTGVGQLAMLLGASVAGVLISVFNPWGAIWFDAASFLVCAVLVATLVRMPPPAAAAPAVAATIDGATVDGRAEVVAQRPAPPVRESYLEELRGGFGYLRQDHLLRGLISMLLVTNLFAQAATVVFIPLWIDNRLHHSPIALGFIGAGFAVGGIAGNALFTAVGPRLPRYLTFIIGYFIGGAPRFLVMAFSHSLAAVVAVWFVSGFALSSANPTIGAVVYQRVPSRLLARVSGLVTAISFAGLSIGGLVGGWAVESIGFTAAIVVAAIVYFVANLAPVVGYRTWRQIDVVVRGRKAASAAARGRLTVTLAHEDGQWTASARRRDGTMLARRYPVAAPQALRALRLLHPPDQRSGLTGLLADEQAATRLRTQRLRAELDDAHARLTELAALVDAGSLAYGAAPGPAPWPGTNGAVNGADGNGVVTGPGGNGAVNGPEGDGAVNGAADGRAPDSRAADGSAAGDPAADGDTMQRRAGRPGV
jgi:predicted MFS family arabinose efflux permease